MRLAASRQRRQSILKIFGMRRTAARFGLALLLMFTTQLVLAGQLCHAIMTRAMAAGDSLQAAHMPDDRMQAAKPCCPHAPMATVDCASAVVSQAACFVSAPEKAPLGNAPPAIEGFPPARFTPSSIAVSVAALPAAHAPPAHIVFGRFLS